jgi:uncharacterized LabA/DUF88 family protein
MYRLLDLAETSIILNIEKKNKRCKMILLQSLLIFEGGKLIMENTKKPKVIFLLDYSNIYYGLEKLGWEIDYTKLKKYIENKYELVGLYYYMGIHSFKSYFDTHPEIDRTDAAAIRLFRRKTLAKQKVIKRLKKVGYIVRAKEISSVYDNTEAKCKLKCNADVEITVDALDKINEYEEAILVSGDSDFVKLVKYLKGKNKKVTAIAMRDRFSNQLKKAANRSIYLNGLRKEIEYKR